MTQEQREAIPYSASGFTVYQTDGTSDLYNFFVGKGSIVFQYFIGSFDSMGYDRGDQKLSCQCIR